MEKYEALEMEVIVFETEDVITTSSNNTNMPEQPFGKYGFGDTEF